MFALYGGLLLHSALHCKGFVVYVLSPDRVIEVVFVPAMLVMSAEPMVGAGTAFLLTTHNTSL